MSGIDQRAQWLEWVTLAVGLLLCVGSLVITVLAAGPPDAGNVLSTLAWLMPWAAVTLPLGFLTSVLCIVTVLRQWDLRGRRNRLRLLTVALLLAIVLLDLTMVEPVLSRLAAATDLESTAVAADVSLLRRLHAVRGAIILLIALSLVAAHRAPLLPPAATSADGLTSRHRTLLFMVGTATLFEGYDRFITTLALPYIGKDLGATESTLGWALAFIRIGALLSLAMGRLADRHGRRRVLIVSVTAYTVATAATGFSTGLIDFALFQLVAAIFLATELTLAQVVIAEEFPPAVRGFGQGILGAFAALGAGCAAILFPVLQRTALGWRGMYLIGVLPLLVVAYLRRNLPETQRWKEAGRATRPRLRDLWQPSSRPTLVILTVISGAATATAAPAFSFASYRATTLLGWSPGQVSSMIVGGGALGFFGYFVLGRLADGVGRRTIGAVGLVSGAAAVAAFYQTTWLLPAFALVTLTESGVLIAVNALTTELFPTPLRATAKAWVTNSATVGALIGLGAVGALSERAGGHAAIITALAAGLIFLAPLFFLLRETRHVALEQIDAAA